MARRRSEVSNQGPEIDPVQSAVESGVATYAILMFVAATAGTVAVVNYDKLAQIAEETPEALEGLIQTIRNALDSVA